MAKYAVKTVYTVPGGKDVYDSWTIRERIKYLKEQAQIVYTDTVRAYDEGTNIATVTATTHYITQDAYNQWLSFLSGNGEQANITQHNTDNGITSVQTTWEV